MNILFDVYKQLENPVFQTNNLRSLYNKIKIAKNTSIEESLIHEFRRLGRGPYKLNKYIQKIIKKYYSNPLRYSTREITNMVNQELISRQKPIISYSTVLKFINQPEVKNQCEILRLGKKYAEQNLLPHLHRIKPEFSGQVIQLDSTRINIPFLNEYNEISYLNLCAAIDVYSSKIIGFSFAINEDVVMILECLKKSFFEMKIIPTQIIIDNHKAYTSKVYKEFKSKAEIYGIDHRHSKVGNPKDKGHIERWFYTFQTMYLNNLFGSLGNGIKSREIKGRTNSKLEKFYMKKENLRKRKELELELGYLIEKYNNNLKIRNKSPNEIFQSGIIDGAREFTIDDIAKLFFERRYFKVKKSTIIMIIQEQKFIYVVYNEVLANKINGTHVLVMFDPSDLNKVYLFNRISHEYYGVVNQFIPVSIIPNSKEKKVILKHQKKIKEMIYRNTQSLVKEIEQGEEELEAIPLKTIKEINNKYEIKKKEQEKLVFEFAVNTITKESKFYNSIKNKKSMSGIMPVKPNRKRDKNNKIQVIDKSRK